VISPFSKPHYVDHTPIDTTAILKLIELRFNLNSLTARDAAQPDISKLFFDFTNKPNLTPPTPPTQPTNGPCYITSLP
jgi:phospholipase C